MANTCETPVTENLSRMALSSMDLSPSVMADVIASPSFSKPEMRYLSPNLHWYFAAFKRSRFNVDRPESEVFVKIQLLKGMNAVPETP